MCRVFLYEISEPAPERFRFLSDFAAAFEPSLPRHLAHAMRDEEPSRFAALLFRRPSRLATTGSRLASQRCRTSPATVDFG